MSSESIDLVTKLVLLAIALIGLYKAAKYKTDGAAAESQAPAPRKEENEYFSLLKDYVGIYALILVPLAFMFLWQFGMKMITDIHESEPAQQEIEQLEIDDDSSELEIMLAAASRISNPFTQAVQLVEVVSLAIERQEFEVAIRAASAITTPSTKDQQLKRVMDAATTTKPSQDREPPQDP